MPHTPPPNDVQELLQRLAQAQKTIEHEDGQVLRKVERVDKAVRLVVWAIFGVAAVVVWVVTQEFKIAAIEKELAKRNIVVERVNELWMMKEYGITNKEAYQQKHGRPPQTHQ